MTVLIRFIINKISKSKSRKIEVFKSKQPLLSYQALWSDSQYADGADSASRTSYAYWLSTPKWLEIQKFDTSKFLNNFWRLSQKIYLVDCWYQKRTRSDNTSVQYQALPTKRFELLTRVINVRASRLHYSLATKFGCVFMDEIILK